MASTRKTVPPLELVARAEKERAAIFASLGRIDRVRYLAIVHALDAGESLTAIARVLGVSRQALTKYLDRRETP